MPALASWLRTDSASATGTLSTEPAPTGLDAMDAEARDREMRQRLAATALTLYIDRHFRNSRDGQMLELNPVDGATEMDAG